MGSEKSWQLKDWWSSLGKNGWPLLVGSFYRDELLHAISAQTRRALLTDLLSYLLWINYLSILSWFDFEQVQLLLQYLTKPSPRKHTHMVLNIGGLLSPRRTTQVLQLSRRLSFTKNKILSTKHTSKVMWKWPRAAEFHKQHLDVFCHFFCSSGHCSLTLFPFTHHPFSTPFTKVSSSLEQWACNSLQRTLVNINWCFQYYKLLKICSLWLITKYTLCSIQEY